MRNELFNNKNSRRKVESCVNSCRIQLFRTNFSYDMSHPTCRIMCHGNKDNISSDWFEESGFVQETRHKYQGLFKDFPAPN